MIAVVIPVFDQARYIGEALDSVFAQTVQPSEVVVVDDGSSDSSAEIAEARGVRTLRLPHVGVGRARAAGVRAVSAPLIAFLDADDLLEPCHHELLSRALDESGADLACGQSVEFAEPGTGSGSRYRIRTEPRVAPLAGSSMVRTGPYLDAMCADPRNLEHDWAPVVRRLSACSVEELVMRRRIHGENSSVRQREEIRGRLLASARASILEARSRSR